MVKARYSRKYGIYTEHRRTNENKGIEGAEGAVGISGDICLGRGCMLMRNVCFSCNGIPAGLAAGAAGIAGAGMASAKKPKKKSK